MKSGMRVLAQDLQHGADRLAAADQLDRAQAQTFLEDIGGLCRQ